MPRLPRSAGDRQAQPAGSRPRLCFQARKPLLQALACLKSSCSRFRFRCLLIKSRAFTRRFASSESLFLCLRKEKVTKKKAHPGTRTGRLRRPVPCASRTGGGRPTTRFAQTGGPLRPHRCCDARFALPAGWIKGRSNGNGNGQGNGQGKGEGQGQGCGVVPQWDAAGGLRPR